MGLGFGSGLGLSCLLRLTSGAETPAIAAAVGVGGVLGGEEGLDLLFELEGEGALAEDDVWVIYCAYCSVWVLSSLVFVMRVSLTIRRYEDRSSLFLHLLQQRFPLRRRAAGKVYFGTLCLCRGDLGWC